MNASCTEMPKDVDPPPADWPRSSWSCRDRRRLLRATSTAILRSSSASCCLISRITEREELIARRRWSRRATPPSCRTGWRSLPALVGREPAERLVGRPSAEGAPLADAVLLHVSGSGTRASRRHEVEMRVVQAEDEGGVDEVLDAQLFVDVRYRKAFLGRRCARPRGVRGGLYAWTCAVAATSADGHAREHAVGNSRRRVVSTSVGKFGRQAASAGQPAVDSGWTDMCATGTASEPTMTAPTRCRTRGNPRRRVASARRWRPSAISLRDECWPCASKWRAGVGWVAVSVRRVGQRAHLRETGFRNRSPACSASPIVSSRR